MMLNNENFMMETSLCRWRDLKKWRLEWWRESAGCCCSWIHIHNVINLLWEFIGSEWH